MTKALLFLSPHFWLSQRKWFWLALTCLSFPLIAQKAQIEFFQTSEHLSSPDPLKMVQDEDGFLWVLGQSLDRYDGYNFVNIKEQEKVWSDYHLNGEHHFCSESFLIHRSEDYFHWREIKTGRKDSINFRKALLKGEVVNENFFFHETKDGRLYFFFFEPSTGKTTFLALEDGSLERKFFRNDVGKVGLPHFSSLRSDAQGNFYYFNKENTHFIIIDKEGRLLRKIPRPETSKLISFIKISANNSFYVVSQNEVFYLKENAQTFTLHPICQYLSPSTLFIDDLLEMPNGDLWICGANRKLLCYEKATGKIKDYQEEIFQLIPHKASFQQLLSDQTDVVWVKIQHFGILKVVPRQSLFDTYFTEPECAGFCSFRGMAENEYGQIFASFYYGVFQIDPISKTSQKLLPQIDQYAPFGLGYHNGQLLLNSGQCLDVATGKPTKNIPLIPDYNSDEGAMVCDDSGNWWNGQKQGVWFFDVANKQPKWEKKVQLPVEEGKISCLHFGVESKRIWIPIGHQIYYYDIADEALVRYSEIREKEKIYAIFEDEERNIWLGTQSGLMMIEPEDKRLKRYSTKDGLPHDYVSSILSEGDSCLWLGTNSGLSRFQKEREAFTNFYTEHGLSHNEFNRISAFKAKDGQLFFGGVRGINAFYPQELMQQYQQQQNIGKVVLSSASHFDEKLDTTIKKTLNLNQTSLEYFHWDKSITYEFSLTDYRKSTKNQYSYLLEGYDNAWSVPSTYNFAKYNSLPAGDYIFRAKAFDAKGYWNPNELAIPIKVYPPWWKTSWAYLAYSLIICGIFYGIYRLLQYRLELENQFYLEQKEAQRLKELDAFKSRLFTNLTHEFRTPLTVILGMTKQLSKRTQELKIEDKSKDTMLYQAQVIERNGQSLLRVVNQLLDLSKLENKAFQINWQNGDVLPFLNYTISSFQAFANQQNLVLKFSSKLEALKMDYDPALLQQVVINLLSNAIKFTASGGSIMVRVNHLTREENDFLQIVIQDTGVGIPQDQLANIFDRFYQVDSSTTRAGEGTGIGLAHAKELVKLMEGDIEVQSKPGEGTTFRVNLPVKNEFKGTENLLQTKFIKNKWPRQDLTSGKKRIHKVDEKVLHSGLPKLLLIEDNADVVNYLRFCLEADYQIDVAYNGNIGVEKAMQNVPDLIISDIMMPEKDGFEVCDILKNDEKTSHIPIILLTAKADMASRIDGLKRGADAYLSKPFDQEELEVRLQALLLRQQKLIRYFSNRNHKTDIERSEQSSEVADEIIRVEDAFIQKVEAILEENYTDKNFSLTQLCQKVGMSRSQLFRKMKALTASSPSRFIRSFRLKKAKMLLETTGLNVSEVAWATGFSSLPHFSRVYQEEFGMSPSATYK